jgi:endo-1,3-1,4-beta-glycanase ExoK
LLPKDHGRRIARVTARHAVGGFLRIFRAKRCIFGAAECNLCESGVTGTLAYDRPFKPVRKGPVPMPNLARSAALVSFACILGAPVAAQSPTAFREDFDRLSPDVWLTSDGWTNGDHQNCTWSKRAVEIADGKLRLSFLPDAKGHLCGEVQTNATFHHGTYEARIRTGTGSGLNAAFFTYIGPVHDAPHDEIDFEILTRNTGEVSLNTFVSGEPKNGTTVPVDPAADAAFHDYAFIWEPGLIRWFVDGVEVHRATETLPVTPQKLYFSLWGSDTLTDWMGPFTAPDGPVVMEVDWTAFTPLGQPCQFPESVLCETR